MRGNAVLGHYAQDAVTNYALIYVARFKRATIHDSAAFPDYLDTGEGLARSDSKQLILNHLEPYFDSLEKLVGKEVCAEQIFPHFGELRFGLFRIPGSHYNLHLEEYDSISAPERMAFNDFPMKELETSQPTKKIAFIINRIFGISDVIIYATVGALAYEGRARK
jgi:hypothetical protein